MISPQHPEVDTLIADAETWRAERVALRAILLDVGLVETLKWGKACYAYKGQTVAIFFGLKATCGIGFFKGSPMDDPNGVLIQQGKNSQAMRLMVFDTVDAINTGKAALRGLLSQAKTLEDEGRKVSFSQKHALTYPSELQDAFARDYALETAFLALTPGRQHGYVLHFSDAKQTKTRRARIEKYRARILQGRGRNDPA